MSLLRVVIIALATLFLFAGFAVAGKDDHPPSHHYHHKINAPNVTTRSENGYAYSIVVSLICSLAII